MKSKWIICLSLKSKFGQSTVAMEQTLENDDFGCTLDPNVKITKKTTNKCHQCDYASSHKGNLRKHFKTHSGEKSNRCNQCDFASSHADHLKRHLKTHSGNKSKK